jgi:homoaconitase/3-isopropylmalate dehydratase large subunit
MSIEAGARAAMIAPDETTSGTWKVERLHQRRFISARFQKVENTFF